MRRAFLQAFLIFVLLALPLAGLWWRGKHPREARPPAEGGAPQTATQAAVDPPEALVPQDPSAAASARAGSLEPGWVQALLDARQGRDRRGGLRAIANELLSLPPAEAVARIERFLETGADVGTGLAWDLGPHGELRAAPTLRVWLLDLLGRISPKAAAEWARATLEQSPSGSADEWALHLRNLAWGEGEPAAAFLADRTLAMLGHSEWRSSPSAGFQEAFDVFVWADAVGAVPELVRLLPMENGPALRHPANLALDRLLLAEPERVLPALLADLAILDGLPEARAGFFARADFADPDQARTVASYFLDPRLSSAERSAFLALVPNGNLTFSYSLLTQNASPTHAAVVVALEHTRACLASWLTDPRFAPWQDEIARTVARLERHD